MSHYGTPATIRPYDISVYYFVSRLLSPPPLANGLQYCTHRGLHPESSTHTAHTLYLVPKSIPPPLNVAAWKVRPSGPDRGLHRAAAYVPANTNAHVGTQASTHWRGISLSAPHVGFDCETLEQRNVKGVPRQEHTREATSYLFYISLDTPAGGVGWPLGRGWSQPERGGKCGVIAFTRIYYTTNQ